MINLLFVGPVLYAVSMTATEKAAAKATAHAWLSAQEIIMHDIQCDCLSCYIAIQRYYS